MRNQNTEGIINDRSDGPMIPMRSTHERIISRRNPLGGGALERENYATVLMRT